MSRSIDRTSRFVLACSLVALAGCPDIESTNPNQPTGGFSEEPEEIFMEVPEGDEPPPPTGSCSDLLPEGITEADVADWYALQVALVGEEAAADALCALFETAIPEAILHSSDDVPPPDEAARWAWLKLRSHYKLPIAATAIEALGCGESDLGLVICPGSPVETETEYYVVTEILDAPLPLDAPDFFGQYAVVFDQDGDETNNYEASPSYPNDFFLGTDRWYQLSFSPGSAPTVTANDTTSGFVDVYFTGARVVIKGATITFLIPVSELPSRCPGQRVTAFTHHGDYGFQPPNFWAGDTEPTVFDPLESVCSE
jgi:hypothetical protein